jgi:hypothetical protein
VRKRDADVRRVSAQFGADDGGHGVFAAGGEPGLIGRRWARLPRAAPTGRAELDDPRAFADVDPDAGSLPVFLSGDVSGVPASRTLAIGVNGRIAATTTTVDSGLGVRFEALLDPSTVRRGANDVVLFELLGTPDGRRLAPLNLKTESYQLVDGEALVSSTGRRIPIGDGIDGFTDTAEVDGNRLRVGGWSAAKRRGAADKIVVFLDDRYLTARRPSVPRPDLLKTYGTGALLAGFSTTTSVEGRPDADAVRVFAILDGRAAELERSGGS